jgi:ribosome-associated protein
VASKAVLHWNVRGSTAIPEDVRRRLAARESRRINVRGELVLTSQRYRDQPRNVEDCLEKLVAIVAAAAKKPRPRKKTRPTKASREARLSQKRVVADKKRQRRQPKDEN